MMIYFEFINEEKLQTIVFVHGFTQNRKIFYRQVSYFKNMFNILLVDLRGHGNSANLEGPYGVEEYTNDLQEIFDSLSIKNVIYWGTHTGSAIGLNLLFRNSQYISAMILEGVVIPGYNTPGIDKNINRAKSMAKSKGIDNAIKDWISSSEWFSYMKDNPNETRFLEHCKIINEFTGAPWIDEKNPIKPPQISKKLNKIRIPIFIYNGLYDMEEFKVMANVLKQSIKSDSYVIENSGGFPLWENPDIVNMKVLNWLKNIGAVANIGS